MLCERLCREDEEMATDWERAFAGNMSEEGLVLSVLSKELQSSTVKKQIIQLQNRQKA